MGLPLYLTLMSGFWQKVPDGGTQQTQIVVTPPEEPKPQIAPQMCRSIDRGPWRRSGMRPGRHGAGSPNDTVMLGDESPNP